MNLLANSLNSLLASGLVFNPVLENPFAKDRAPINSISASLSPSLLYTCLILFASATVRPLKTAKSTPERIPSKAALFVIPEPNASKTAPLPNVANFPTPVPRA